MNTKILIVTIFIVVIGLGVYYYNHSKNQAMMKSEVGSMNSNENIMKEDNKMMATDTSMMKK